MNDDDFILKSKKYFPSKMFLSLVVISYFPHFASGIVYNSIVPPVNCSVATTFAQMRQCMTTPCSTTDTEAYLQHGCYNNDMPPSEPTVVTFIVMPFLLKDVDERGQRVKLQFIVTSAWRDPRLKWTPPFMHGTAPRNVQAPAPPMMISIMTFPSKRVWRPNFVFSSGTNDVFVNSGSDDQSGAVMDSLMHSPQVSVFSDGIVVDSSYYIDWTYCAFDGRHFPFETSECQITIFSSDSTVKFVLPLDAYGNALNLSQSCAAQQPAAVLTKAQRNTLFRMRTYTSTNDPSYGDGPAPNNNNNSDQDDDGDDDEIQCLLSFSGPSYAQFFSSVLSGDMSSAWRTAEWQLRLSANGPTVAQALIQYNVTFDFGTNKTTATFTLVRSAFQQVIMWVCIPGSLSLVASLTIVTVCDRTERYGFGSAIVLALVMMQTGLSDKMMPSETGAPLILWYFIVLEECVVFACVATSISEVWMSRKVNAANNKAGGVVLKAVVPCGVTSCAVTGALALHINWWLVGYVVFSYAMIFFVFGAYWTFNW